MQLRTFSTVGLHRPLLVLLQRPFAGKNGDFCGAQTHIRKSGGRQPAVGCKPHLQQQCDEFPRFDFACGGYSTGGLRPPLLVLLQRPFAGKNGDFCGAQTQIPRSGGRQPAVVC